MNTLLEVNDLRTRFHTPEGTVFAVNGISFFLNEGETLAVVGESGCGKSVTMMSILGLIPIPPGEIVSGRAHLSRRRSAAHDRAGIWNRSAAKKSPWSSRTR